MTFGSAPENLRGQAPSPRRKLLYAAIVVFLLLLLAEAAARVMLRLVYGPRLAEAQRIQEYDSELGWVNMKSRRVLDRFGEGKHATQNSLGLRASREYTAAVPPGRYRIILLGDSFTYGVGAGDAGTFVAQLESLAPSLETLNLGVAGYGIDQMYLWYLREKDRFAANLLVLAFIADDVHRMTLRAFLTQNPKPRLRLDGNALTVENVPVPTWGNAAQTAWLEEFPDSLALVQIARSVYELYLQNYDPLPVADRVIAELNRLANDKQQRFALVYLPAQSDLERERPSAAALHLREFTARERIPFFDLTGELMLAQRQQSAPLFVANGGHYSETGYKVVAESLLDDLRKQFPDVPR